MKDIRYFEVRDNDMNNLWNMCFFEFIDFDLYGFELDWMVLFVYKFCYWVGLYWNSDLFCLINIFFFV